MNVLVCRTNDGGRYTWVAKLADFGGSVLDVEKDQMGSLSMGSFPWQAPEWKQWLTRDGLLKTDVYSLGLVYWSIITAGRIPVEDDPTSFSIPHVDTEYDLWVSVSKMKSDPLDTFLHKLMLSGEKSFPPDMDIKKLRSVLAVSVVQEPSKRNLKQLIAIMRRPNALDPESAPSGFEEELAELNLGSPTKQIATMSRIENIFVCNSKPLISSILTCIDGT